MDLVNTIHKKGSRGGVNFSWEDVASSQHRENYLGHSLKAPVGRWQKGRDLNWYAKADATAAESGETEEQREESARKEELRRIKEAEEDAMAKALGLPPPQRNVTGVNAMEIEGTKRFGPPTVDSTTQEGGRERSIEIREKRSERQRSRDRGRKGHGDRRRDRSLSRGRHHRRQHSPTRRDRSRERHDENSRRGYRGRGREYKDAYRRDSPRRESPARRRLSPRGSSDRRGRSMSPRSRHRR